MVLRYVLLALALGGAAAECPNACSGHGDCINYDQCICYRNWQGSDCSQRTCPFGLAHVDSPKGDLDSSADALSGPDTTVLLHSTVYPYGTQEQFPNMTTSRGTELTQTAHYYMECSNKGICDRGTGECDCFEGYEGSSCQRASCPNDCSGHGTCEHVKTLAAQDFGNIYDLWDAEMTMGCKCDAGYSGPDCSGRDCKYGIDPLYVDDEATARVETVDYRIYVNDYSSTVTRGTYALKFYDVFGEDYETGPIKITANCSGVRDALEALPNTVVPYQSIQCSDEAHPDKNYAHYSLTFRGNPGYLKQLFVDTYLDGSRATVYDDSDHADHNPTVEIFNTGVTGEFTDYFATQCRHVYATIATHSASIVSELNSGYQLSVLNVENAPSGMGLKLLKQCLGDSDGVEGDNVEVYDWDYGSIQYETDKYMMSSYPHAVKLVEVDPADDFQGGFYYLTWWEPQNELFVIANRPASANVGGTYAVYATDGVVERVIIDHRYQRWNDDVSYTTGKSGDNGAGEINEKAQNEKDARITAYFEAYTNVLYTSYDTACETAYESVEPCLDKGDMLFIIDSKYAKNYFDPDDATMYTPSATAVESGNIYTITKIYKEDPTQTTFEDFEDRFRIVVDKNVPFAGTTKSAFLNASNTEFAQGTTGIVNLFKFSPATTGNYEFVSQCSNRGTCDEGTCACFKGYTNDNCDVQSSLAV
jgi:hypothetical protein